MQLPTVAASGRSITRERPTGDGESGSSRALRPASCFRPPKTMKPLETAPPAAVSPTLALPGASARRTSTCACRRFQTNKGDRIMLHTTTATARNHCRAPNPHTPEDRAAKWLLAIALLAAVLASGCASNRVARTAEPLIYQTVSDGSHPALRKALVGATPASAAALRLTVDPADAPSADYRLDLDFTVRNKGTTDAEKIWQQTTLMLLTLYPSTCGRFELALTGELYDRHGNRLKTWHLVEQDTAFLWLLQGKNCGNTPSERTVAKIAKDMLGELYSRVSDPSVFSHDQPAVPGGEHLVYVVAQNAEQLIKRVVKTDEPFSDFTFDAGSAKKADRVVSIGFDFVQPEQGIGSVLGRGVGAFFTLGLMGICKPSEMVLHAEVLDGDRTTIRAYRYAEKTQAGSDVCVPATDRSHPEVATRLLRRLFKQMEKDGLA